MGKKEPKELTVKGQSAGASIRVPDGGPIDTFRHGFRPTREIQAHVASMEHTKSNVEERILQEENNIATEREKLSNVKSVDDAERQNKEDKAFAKSETAQARNAELTNRAVDDAQTIVHMSARYIVIIFAWLWHNFLIIFDWIWRNFLIIFDWVFRHICIVFDWIWNNILVKIILALWAVLKGIFKVLKFFGKPFLYLLFAAILIAICVVIIYFFVMFILGLFSPKSSGGGGGGGIGGIGGVGGLRIPDTLNINLHNFGKFYSGDKVSSSLITSFEKAVPIKPDFIKIPEFKYSASDLVSKPTDYVSGCVSYLYDGARSLGPVQDVVNTAVYCKNFVVQNVNYITGNTQEIDESISFREEERRGRCDNVLNIDSSVFSNQSLLRDRSIDATNVAVNIGRPKDIEWDMPEVEYRGTDLNRVPPSLMSKKDENGVSLNDKRAIVIPWVRKNDNYVLSCDDAYFKSSATEKANVLIDNDDTTCSLNIESRPVTFSEDRRRYKASNDLSAYI